MRRLEPSVGTEARGDSARVEDLSKQYPSTGSGQGSGRCLPVSEVASREVLSLPLYPELTEAQQQEVGRAIGEFYGR